jgi:hypothetical protein
MKRVLIVLSILSTLTSCLNFNFNFKPGKAIRCKGPVVEKSFDLKDFQGITVNGQADITLTQADAFSVVVKANEDAFEYLNYRVEEGELILETKDHVNLLAKELDVYVSLPLLTSIIVNGAADVELKGNYKAEKPLSMTVNGAGDFELNGLAVPSLSFTLNGAGDIEANDLDVEKLAVSINGAGDIVLGGKAAEATVSVRGAGDVDATNLECPKWDTHRAGLASIKTGK